MKGIDCCHQTVDIEDKIRIKIDNAIKKIIPTLFPPQYALEFIPVCTESDILKGKYIIEHSGHNVTKLKKSLNKF